MVCQPGAVGQGAQKLQEAPQLRGAAACTAGRPGVLWCPHSIVSARARYQSLPPGNIATPLRGPDELPAGGAQTLAHGTRALHLSPGLPGGLAGGIAVPEDEHGAPGRRARERGPPADPTPAGARGALPRPGPAAESRRSALISPSRGAALGGADCGGGAAAAGSEAGGGGGRRLPWRVYSSKRLDDPAAAAAAAA